MRGRTQAGFVAVVTVLTVVLAGTGLVVADGHVSLVAGDEQAASGETVTVSFTIENTGSSDLDGPALDVSELPDGWTVVDRTDDGATYRNAEQQWLWLSLSTGAERTASLTLSVPDDADGTYEIPASVLVDGESIQSATATVTVSDQGTDSTESESDGSDASDGTGGEGVQSDDAVVNLDADTTALTDNETARISVTIENTGNETVNGPAVVLDELPAEWAVRDRSDDGATYRDAEQQWLWLSIPADESRTVEMLVDTTGQPLDGQELEASALIEGSTVATVTVEPDDGDESDASGRSGDGGESDTDEVPSELGLTVENATVDADGNVSFELVLANEGDKQVDGPAVDLSLPDGWSVVEYTTDGGSYRSSEHQWLWLSLEGRASKTLSVTLVPDDDVAANVSAEALVDGNVVATASVNASEIEDSGDEETSDGSTDGATGAQGPGFGLVTVLFAIAVTTLLLRRRDAP